ncbi:toxin-antitoxin system [Cnuibacter sp. UC19_7]|uniref:FitA-like ribbon-helix-helix domain-containing protein n=1 Tax=Cnuibacter sp. UC19_7 TaxID=3350166 RepID=UPI00366F3787
MGAIAVRGLDDSLLAALKERAAAHGRSTEAEVRAILADAVASRGFAQSWLDATESLRGADVALPTRSAGRVIEL